MWHLKRAHSLTLEVHEHLLVSPKHRAGYMSSCTSTRMLVIYFMSLKKNGTPGQTFVCNLCGNLTAHVLVIGLEVVRKTTAYFVFAILRASPVAVKLLPVFHLVSLQR